MNTAELARLGRTVIRLRQAQGGQRARLRTQRMLLDHSVPLAERGGSSRGLAGQRPGLAVRVHAA